MSAQHGSSAPSAVPVSDPSNTVGMYFCPNCAHRSRFDGEWVVIETGNRLRYLCPNCSTEITTRSTGPD